MTTILKPTILAILAICNDTSAAEQIQRGDGDDGFDEDIERVAWFKAPTLRLLIADVKLQDRQIVLSHDSAAFCRTQSSMNPPRRCPQDRAVGA